MGNNLSITNEQIIKVVESDEDLFAASRLLCSNTPGSKILAKLIRQMTGTDHVAKVIKEPYQYAELLKQAFIKTQSNNQS